MPFRDGIRSLERRPHVKARARDFRLHPRATMCNDINPPTMANATGESPLDTSAAAGGSTWEHVQAAPGGAEAASVDHYRCGAAKRKACDMTEDSADDDMSDKISRTSTSVGSPAESEPGSSRTAPAEQQLGDKPSDKARKAPTKNTSYKTQKTCMYEHCPSPMHSSKWRVVTATTVAGGRDWQSLCGMTLCDSCYSTFRKHGTFIRSVRTSEGWARFDHSAQTHILNKPSKKRVAPIVRPVKRARPAPLARCSVVVSEDTCRPKRERKPSTKLRDLLQQDDESEGEPITPMTCEAPRHDVYREWPPPAPRHFDAAMNVIPHHCLQQPAAYLLPMLQPEPAMPQVHGFYSNLAMGEDDDMSATDSSSSLPGDEANYEPEIDFFYNAIPQDLVDGVGANLVQSFEPFDVMA